MNSHGPVTGLIMESKSMLKSLIVSLCIGISLVLVIDQTFAGELEWKPVACPGEYPIHLQGTCADDDGSLYWSFTTKLVKTDSQGQELKTIPVANHHGDLCFHDGRIFVAVNLGKFNQPAGKADSWVYEYDAETLTERARHPVPEVVHGAGGIGYREGKFLVVGGLPNDIEENFLYEYGEDWTFRKRHQLQSGQTDKGIQTITFHDGFWWMGCYGSPAILLKADTDLQFVGRWPFPAAIGLIGTGEGQFLVARDPRMPGKPHRGMLVPAVVTKAGTLEIVKEKSTPDEK